MKTLMQSVQIQVRALVKNKSTILRPYSGRLWPVYLDKILESVLLVLWFCAVERIPLWCPGKQTKSNLNLNPLFVDLFFSSALRLVSVLLMLCSLFMFIFPGGASSEETSDLMDLTVEELINIEITSASKKPEKLSEVPAAIFVITNEDIRRSGATSIPEVLRMAPGIEVARFDANKWAITSRGFNGLYSSKLLVLIDGRSIYDPLFSGIYWDIQDTLLEDIDRIEVIRGPGATIWGANAVNGVINIITKRAKDTQGWLVTAGVGTEEQGITDLRYGGTSGEDSSYRVWAKYVNRDSGVLPTGGDGVDEWDVMRAGFRFDRQASDRNSFWVMGDIYDGDSRTLLTFPEPASFTMRTIRDTTKVRGGNILARLEHSLSASSKMALQFYYDRTEREYSSLKESRNTFDIDFNHCFLLGDRLDIIWGLGYRYTRDRTDGSFAVAFDPDSRREDLFSAFVQGEITLIEDLLSMNCGSKFEYNGYTGFEYQPSLRFLWTPYHRHSVWTSVSRAVRTPARANHDIRINFAVIPPATVMSIFGDKDFNSEELFACELGYRFLPTDHISIDIAAFYNSYDNLLTNEPGNPFFEADPTPPHLVIPLYMNNKMDGDAYGIEAAVKWALTDCWEIRASYSFLQIQLDSNASSGAIDPESDEGQSPHNRFNLQSCLDLPYGLEFDQSLFYVDNLSGMNIKNYIRVDARLGWRPTDGLEFSICGQNLFDSQHFEFGDGDGLTATKVERSVYGKVTWKF